MMPGIFTKPCQWSFCRNWCCNCNWQNLIQSFLTNVLKARYFDHCEINRKINHWWFRCARLKEKKRQARIKGRHKNYLWIIEGQWWIQKFLAEKKE